MEATAQIVDAHEAEIGTGKGARIEFEHITAQLALKDKTKAILTDVSASVQSGRLTALMGPSGSGKTSLLNALAGRTKHIKGLKLTGTISVNGTPVTQWSKYRRLCAYVEQDDLLFHTLTVTETLMLAAQLRLPRKMSYAQKTERVKQVIAELGLRKCADTRIGNAKVRGVSGGERKRVSIALEILRGPQVLFLDECTSGLDSFQALRVIETIKGLARNGRTIVTSIHQPRSSIFSLFDDLILLSEGKLMYFGAAQKMTDYFLKLGFEMPKNFNPADFALDLVSIDVRNQALEAESRGRFERIASAAAESLKQPKQISGESPQDTDSGQQGDADLLDTKYSYEAPYYLQFLLLAQRAFRQKLRDPSQLIAPFVVAVCFGTILGFVYFRNALNLGQKALQDKPGLLFFITLNQSFNGLIAVVSTFPIEKTIVNRERSSKSYAVAPYFFSKVLADLPMLICPFTFYVIAYFLTGFTSEAAIFFQSVFVCLMVYLTANGLGLVASALMQSPEGAQAIAMPLQLIFALFSGFYANTDLIPPALAWIQYVSPIRWGFSGFMSVLIPGMVFECPNPELEGCVPNGHAFLVRLGLSNDSFARSVGILAATMFTLQMVGFTILTFNRAKWVVPKHA